ncbi:hypothetical protein I3760_12G041900 [Carya illinoinensis]|nr:hypothetical protein I3760_12G041900 [Carya illinoinensis]
MLTQGKFCGFYAVACSLKYLWRHTTVSMNHNNTKKNVGAPIPFGNPGTVQTHLLSQSQPQTQSGSHFPCHFQLSEPQTQALALAQAQAPAHAQAQAQAVHVQFIRAYVRVGIKRLPNLLISHDHPLLDLLPKRLLFD